MLKISAPRGTALRRGLPFGSVMATGGASTLAARCGHPVLVAPLLALAVLQALWVTAAGILRHGVEFRSGWPAWLAIGPANEHSGIHTVPLGLAVLTSGLVSLRASGNPPWVLPAAEICLGLTWLMTIACFGRFVWPLASHGLALKLLDGTWFLVPAALLGDGIATAGVSAQVPAHGQSVLALIALGSVLLGSAAYWTLAAIALARVRRHGLGGARLAPWWIAMGCAGLAAAAMGRMLQDHTLAPLFRVPLADVAITTAGFAAVLCIPTLSWGIWFLFRHCRFRAAAAWPPAFSTAVFALGFLQIGEVLRLSPFRFAGVGVAYTALGFWTATSCWNLKCVCSTLVRRLARISAAIQT